MSERNNTILLIAIQRGIRLTEYVRLFLYSNLVAAVGVYISKLSLTGFSYFAALSYLILICSMALLFCLGSFGLIGQSKAIEAQLAEKIRGNGEKKD